MRSWTVPKGSRTKRNALVAGLIAAVLAVSIPLLASDALRCRVSGCDRPEAAPRPTPSERRTLTPEQIALQGAYVALGDSYSSGEGAYATPADLAPGNRCHRTSQSYVHTVSRTFTFAGGLKFHACSGARTGHILAGKEGERPQIGRVNARTSLITLSIGGNDVGFSRVLAGCMTKVSWTTSCEAQRAQIDAAEPALRRALAGILDELARRAPKARIIVLGYPALFAARQPEVLGRLTIAEQHWLNARGRELDDLIGAVVLKADRALVKRGAKGSVEFVDAYPAFAGHEVGTAAPYVNGLDLDLRELKVKFSSYHPTAAGYAALAELVAAQVRRGPAREIPQFR